MKIFIYGGCVSRDTLNYMEPGSFELVGYYARSCYASAFGDIPVIDNWSHNVKSNFQRRMVKADLSKTLTSELVKNDYDLLMLDFNLERHSLFVFDDGSCCTISAELNSGGFDCNELNGRMIKPMTEEMYNLWENGWIKFLKVVDSVEARKKILINRLNWTSKIDDNTAFDKKFSPKVIDSTNDYLNKIYSRIEKDLEPEQFFEISNEHNIASSTHRWGVSPFHYVDSFYEELASYLKNQRNRMKEKNVLLKEDVSFDAYIENGEILSSIVLNKQIDSFAKYAFYLMCNGEKVAVKSYSKESYCKFDNFESKKKYTIVGFVKIDNEIVSVKKVLTGLDFKTFLFPIRFYEKPVLNKKVLFVRDNFHRANYTITKSKSDEFLNVKLPIVKDNSFVICMREGIKWSVTFEKEERSSLMWFYSLHSIGSLIDEYKKTKDVKLKEFILVAVASFIEFCDDSINLRSLELIPSPDHSAAARVLVLLKFLEEFHGELSTETFNCILQNAQYWTEWLATDRYYLKNNHSLMSDIAILNFFSFISMFEGATVYFDFASKRILSLAEFIFDKDGYSNENTIGYHRFNIVLFDEVLGFISHLESGAGSNSKKLSSLLQKAKRALRICIWQDSKIPPIGDSPIIQTNESPINKSSLFSESGFAVVKNEDIYLSLICGGRGVAHKHVDDTSITLRYRGVDVFIDGGSFNYDEKNPYRQYVRSAAAHTGLYLSSMERLSPKEYFRDLKPQARITDFIESENSVLINCQNVLLDRKVVFKRSVLVAFPDEIAIKDSFELSEEFNDDPVVQRFLFGKDIKSVLKDGFVSMICGEVEATMFKLDFSWNESFSSQVKPKVKGWCSEKPNQITPSSSMEFTDKRTTGEFCKVISLSGQKDLNNFSTTIKEFAGLQNKT